MTTTSRDILFISHATPEDNEFAIWLASRLQLLGYKVWLDKNALAGGEKFWEDIDQVIRNNAIKYLLVYSKSICYPDMVGKLKDGISKEYSLAESISKQEKFSDFIILLNLDRSAYNLFIGADRINQIQFYENWAKGLEQLHKKLVKDKIPFELTNSGSDFADWFQYHYVTPNPIIAKKEWYYSNIWPIDQLPELIFIHVFRKEAEAKFFYETYKRFPLAKSANNILSFEGDMLYSTTNEDLEVIPEKIYSVRISDIFLGKESPKFPTLIDNTNFLKILLKRVFHMLMKNRGMFWYEMSNKRNSYFYTPANLATGKVSFEYPGLLKRKKTKNLFGVYKHQFKWHYAISVKVVLSPILGFSLRNHLTFTNDGFQVWKNDKGQVDTDKIQIHRRGKGRRLFNEEWRDMLIAFLHALKKENEIKISLTTDFILHMKTFPEKYRSSFGYIDPKDLSRQEILLDDGDLDEEESNDDIKEEPNND